MANTCSRAVIFLVKVWAASVDSPRHCGCRWPGARLYPAAERGSNDEQNGGLVEAQGLPPC
jgi:hypothetical protein